MTEIKEEVVIEEPDFKEVQKEMMLQEAEGKRPPATRRGIIVQVVGERPDRIFAIQYLDTYVFMKESESVDNLPDKLIGQKISFKPVGIEEGRILVSHKAIKEYYRTNMERGAILSGKIVDIIDSRNGSGQDGILFCRGDKLIVPARELLLPSFLKPEERLNRIVDFVVIKVGKYIYASIKKVYEQRLEQLQQFMAEDTPFTATVVYPGPSVSFLTYKENNELTLRNKDFSSDFTFANEVLKPGDKVKVKMKLFTPVSNRCLVEMVEKYRKKPDIDMNDVVAGQQYEGTVVTLSTFGCFVKIGTTQDALCPIDVEVREPRVGEKVVIEIVVADSGKLRGKIVKYLDEKLDLSEYDWD